MTDGLPAGGAENRSADLRVDYSRGRLEEPTSGRPGRAVRAWFNDARAAKVAEPNAMTLARRRGGRGGGSCSSSRSTAGIHVLHQLRQPQGARAGREPAGSAVLFLAGRSSGRCASRRGREGGAAGERGIFPGPAAAAQVGAWVSQQSSPITSRAELERIEAELQRKFEGRPVPLPDYWGGYRVIPKPSSSGRAAPAGCTHRLLYTARGRRRLGPEPVVAMNLLSALLVTTLVAAAPPADKPAAPEHPADADVTFTVPEGWKRGVGPRTAFVIVLMPEAATPLECRGGHLAGREAGRRRLPKWFAAKWDALRRAARWCRGGAVGQGRARRRQCAGAGGAPRVPGAAAEARRRPA